MMNGLGRNVTMAATATDLTTMPRQFKAMIIEYIGTSASALITVGAQSFASAIGPLGSEAADAAFTIGGTPGTIDLTQTGYTTAGPVADFINSLPGYACRLVGLRRGDSITTSGYFKAATSKQAANNGGYAPAVDTTVALQITAEISILDGSMYAGTDIFAKKAYGTNGDHRKNSLVELHQVDETLTYTGTGVFEVIEVDDYANTDEVIYSGAVPGATTAAGTKSFGQLGVSGLTARVGKRLLVRVRAATTLSAITSFVVYGRLKSLN